MLRYQKKKLRWFGKAQSGFYIDFFLKKLIEVFVRNILIYSAMFFGEKYMIEQLTRKLVDFFLFYSNKKIGFFNLSYV